jgi:hypothetical protein
MNYSELSASIQAYTENTDTSFVAQIPVFVKQAEQRINNSVQVANLRKNVTANMTTGNKYVACPTDFLSTYSHKNNVLCFLPFFQAITRPIVMANVAAYEQGHQRWRDKSSTKKVVALGWHNLSATDARTKGETNANRPTILPAI